jgi:hypothetical protein
LRTRQKLQHWTRAATYYGQRAKAHEGDSDGQNSQDRIIDGYNTVYIPGYLAVPGCMGARRYVAVEG